MNRFRLSLFTLFMFLAWCFPLNAQEAAGEESDSTEVQKGIVFSPGPTTMLRSMQVLMGNEQQGKTFFFHMEEDDYKQFIGLTPAQELHLVPQMEALIKKSEPKGLDYIDQLNRWSELSPEELVKVEDAYFDLLSQTVDEMHSFVRETLTPVQLQKAMEYELAAPSTFAKMFGGEELLNFSTYEALELSEEQKEKLAKIQEEIKPELNEFFKEFAKFTEKYSNETEFTGEKQKEFFEIFVKLKEKVKTLSQKYEAKAGEILTQEQKDRLAAIREEVPKKLASIRKELEKKAKENPIDESWKESWKPGDPLPEGAAPPQRKPRFPFKF